MAVVLKNHRLLGPPHSGRIGVVSVACPCRVTDRQQTGGTFASRMALDGRRTIRPRPAGRRCSRCCSVRTRNVSCGRSAAWPRAPARRPARGCAPRSGGSHAGCAQDNRRPRAFRHALLKLSLAKNRIGALFARAKVTQQQHNAFVKVQQVKAVSSTTYRHILKTAATCCSIVYLYNWDDDMSAFRRIEAQRTFA